MENWLTIINDFTESNLSVTSFCKLKDINKSSFYYWRKKLLIEDPNPSGFIKIETFKTTSFNFEIEYPNGVKLRPLGEIPITMLQKLIYV